MLNNNLNGRESKEVNGNIKILNGYLGDLKLGSTYPYYDSNDHDLYQNHFYNPGIGDKFTIDNS